MPKNLTSALKFLEFSPSIFRRNLPPSKLLVPKRPLINSPLISVASKFMLFSSLKYPTLPCFASPFSEVLLPFFSALKLVNGKVLFKSFKMMSPFFAKSSSGVLCSFVLLSSSTSKFRSLLLASMPFSAIFKESFLLALCTFTPAFETVIKKSSLSYFEPFLSKNGMSNLSPFAKISRLTKSLLFMLTSSKPSTPFCFKTGEFCIIKLLFFVPITLSSPKLKFSPKGSMLSVVSLGLLKSRSAVNGSFLKAKISSFFSFRSKLSMTPFISPVLFCKFISAFAFALKKSSPKPLASMFSAEVFTSFTRALLALNLLPAISKTASLILKSPFAMTLFSSKFSKLFSSSFIKIFKLASILPLSCLTGTLIL